MSKSEGEHTESRYETRLSCFHSCANQVLLDRLRQDELWLVELEQACEIEMAREEIGVGEFASGVETLKRQHTERRVRP